MILSIIFVALGLLAGLLILQNQASLPLEHNALPQLLILISLFSLMTAKLFNKNPIFNACVYLIASCVFGFSYGHWRAEIRLADQLPVAWESRDILVEGHIANLPQRLADTPRAAWRFTFLTDKTLTPEAIVPHQIRLVWYGDLPTRASANDQNHDSADADPATEEEMSPKEEVLTPGQRWRLTVRLKRPNGNANPGGFDYEGWLFEHNIRAVGYVRATKSGPPPSYLGQHPWQFSLWIERLRSQLRQQLLTTLPPEQYPSIGILIGLAIGDQAAISPSDWQLFNLTGLTHLMVVSGSHITLLAALIAWLAFRAWARFPTLVLQIPSQQFAATAGWIAAFLYSWLSGLGTPAMRTLCMVSVVTLASLQHQLIRPRHTLALSLIAVLLWDPWSVLSAGFWLSFATVAALLLGATAAYSVKPSEINFVKSGVHVLFTSIQSQWAATLATTPLLLLFFQQLPLVSPLANAIAIPLIGLVVTPLTLLGTCILALPSPISGLGFWPLYLANLILSQLMDWLPILSHWPQWTAASPPAWAIGLAGIGVTTLLLPRGIPSRLTLGLLSLSPALFWPSPRPNPNEWWADVIDVGQGQAVLIRTATHTLLYDTGPRYGTISAQNASPPDAAQRVILPFLRAEGIQRLDRLVVSHKDSDHAGGTETLKQALPIGMVLSPKISPDDALCQQGLSWTWSGVHFEVLHPSPAALEKPPKNTNAVSCVLRVSGPQGSVLLTGDLPEKEEQTLVLSSSYLQSDLLLAPHHGSKTSSSESFLNAVNPTNVLISAGYRNRFGHPHPVVLSRYTERDIRVWRTDQQGTLQVRPNTIHGWRGQHPRYWQQQ